MDFTTQLVHFDAAPGDPCSPTSTPIYQTATFHQESALEPGRYDYSRSGNPTRSVLESQLARLDGGTHAFAFSSGMAAVTTVCRLCSAGDEIVAGTDLYGGSFRLLDRVIRRQGITVRFVDTSDLDAVRRALGRRTRLLLVESPSNPLLQICDLAALAELSRTRGVRLAVDSSLLSPYLQRPLELGADLVIHSATKLLSGHSDLTAGVVVTRDEELAAELGFLQNAEGNALSPFESWLLLRGLKTLALRLDRQQETARHLASWLAARPEVTRVYYPGLPDHPGHALHHAQARGPGCVLSFTTGDRELSRALVDRTRLFTTAVSFGSVGSFISLPGTMSHASIPAEVRQARAFPEDLVRISAGIESPDDLTQDLGDVLELCRNSDARFAAPVGTRQ